MSEQKERKPLEPVLREAEITIYMRKWGPWAAVGEEAEKEAGYMW